MLVHVVGLAPTKSLGGRPIYSRVLLLLSHTCKTGKVHRAKGEDKGNIPGLSEECLYSLRFALCALLVQFLVLKN